MSTATIEAPTPGVTKMNPEVKAAWLERLRSGQIPQVASTLAERDARCCLPEPDRENYHPVYGNEGDTSTAILPRDVMRWAGLPGESRELHLPTPVDYAPLHGDYTTTARCITSLNDSSALGFEGIANVIEEQL